MQDKPTAVEVADKLAAFGSADQIAAFFEQEGIVGVPQEAGSCPVARHMQGQTGGDVIVSQLGASVPGKGFLLRFQYNLNRYVEAYQPIVDFINNFDHGRYPNLVEESK